MRKKLIFIISITALIFTCYNYLYSGYYIKYINEKEVFKPQTSKLDQTQLMGQISFFKEVLDKFGATSPDQVIRIWVEAEKERNGVYHYAVACPDLKKKIINSWGTPEENFWIYGGSSPWLDKYEILSQKKVNDNEYEVKIRFYWITSIPTYDTTETTLKIIKSNDIWCVKDSSNL